MAIYQTGLQEHLPLLATSKLLFVTTDRVSGLFSTLPTFGITADDSVSL